MTHIKEAVKLIGTQETVGKIIGVSQGVVSNWVKGKNKVPAKHIIKISELTKNKVTVEQLLSDHESTQEPC